MRDKPLPQPPALETNAGERCVPMAKEKPKATNQPAAKFRLGYVTATVWKNPGNGDKEFYNVQLNRSYKDDDGNWHDDGSLGHGDLLNAAKVLQRAESFIAEQA